MTSTTLAAVALAFLTLACLALAGAYVSGPVFPI